MDNTGVSYLDNQRLPITITYFQPGLCPDVYDVGVLFFQAHQHCESRFTVVANFGKFYSKGKGIVGRSFCVIHENGYRQVFDMPNGAQRETIKDDLLAIFKRMLREHELWQQPKEIDAVLKYPNCDFIQVMER